MDPCGQSSGMTIPPCCHIHLRVTMAHCDAGATRRGSWQALWAQHDSLHFAGGARSRKLDFKVLDVFEQGAYTF